MMKARADTTGMNLAKIRTSRGLSQKALGEMIGMDAATIQRAETMHSSAKLTTYVACADALGEFVYCHLTPHHFVAAG